MANENGVERIIKIGDGSLEILEPELESGLRRLWARLKGVFMRFMMRVIRFLKDAWFLGKNDSRKVIHSLKVGVALVLVSLFYYVRPLYDGVGGNALWALMTVVLVFEYTVGGTLYKCLNRICATLLGGFLALGVHWVASQSGHRFEPFIMGISLFIIASATTYSRFITQVKARYDYGCTIFILTYGLVLVSGYRVEKLMDVAIERLSTIIIGTCLCIFISMLMFPVWAGMELHLLITCNMNKLANSLESCVDVYFSEGDEESKKKMQDYKCVLNSKAYEKSMVDFARWEPAHGRFNFKHPWKNYIKISSSTSSCAYCIETLVHCQDSKNQVPEAIRNHLSASCLRLSSRASNVLRELTTSISLMTRSTEIDKAIKEMKITVLELQNDLKTLPSLLVQLHEDNQNQKKHELLSNANNTIPFIEIITLVTFVSMLIQIASMIEGDIAKTVEDLASAVKFKNVVDELELQKISISE